MAAKKAPKKNARRPAPPAKKGPAKAAGRRPKASAAKAPPRKAPRKATPKPKASPAAAPSAWAWHEVLTHHLPGAEAFYTQLFGWTARDAQMPHQRYTLFSKDGQDVGGCMAVPDMGHGPVSPPMWLAYLHVQDVDATAQRTVALGGSVNAPPMDIPGVGRMAVLCDPFGATFAVYRPA